MDVEAIMNRARFFLKDQKKSWATDAFLLEGMNHVYETAFLELENINFPFDEVEIPLLGVAANTADLSQFQASGQPLAFMVDVIQLEWKIAGRPDTDYQDVPRTGKLTDVPVGGQQAVDEYEYRGMVVYITPASIAVDLRIRIKQLFGELVGSDGTLAINSVRPYLGCCLAAVTAGVRENYDLAKWLDGRAENLLSLIESNFVKDAQGVVNRLGSPSRMRRGGAGRRYPNLRSS